MNTGRNQIGLRSFSKRYPRPSRMHARAAEAASGAQNVINDMGENESESNRIRDSIEVSVNYYSLLALDDFESASAVRSAVRSAEANMPADALPAELVKALHLLLHSARATLADSQANKMAYDAQLNSSSRSVGANAAGGVNLTLETDVACALPLLILRNGYSDAAARLSHSLIVSVPSDASAALAAYPYCAAMFERALQLRRVNRLLEAASSLALALRTVKRFTLKRYRAKETKQLMDTMDAELSALLLSKSAYADNEPVLLLRLLEMEEDDAIRDEVVMCHLEKLMEQFENLYRNTRRHGRKQSPVSDGDDPATRTSAFHAQRRRHGNEIHSNAGEMYGNVDGIDPSSVSYEFFRKAFAQLRSYELAQLTDWEAVASAKDRGLACWQPALRMAVHALLATGFVYKHPSYVRTARNVLRKGHELLSEVPNSTDIAAMHLLLGDVNTAQEVLEDDEQAVMPAGANGNGAGGGGLVTGTYGLQSDTPTNGVVFATRLPDPSAPWLHRAQPMQYVRDVSLRSGDTVEGICTLVSLWLAKEVLPRFSDAANADATLNHYFDDPSVIATLEAGEPGAFEQTRLKLQQQLANAYERLSNILASATRTLRLQSLFRVPEQFRRRKFPLLATLVATGSFATLFTLAWLVPQVVGPLQALQQSIQSRWQTALCPSWPQMPRLHSRSTKASSSRISIDTAERTIKNWQAAKAQALGKRHDTAQLYSWLSGPMLSDWQDRAERGRQLGVYWDFTLHDVRIRNVSCAASRDISVVADISETALLMDERTGKQRDWYSDTYCVMYEAEQAGNETGFKLCYAMLQ